jgi:electron transport complex protein RnfA
VSALAALGVFAALACNLVLHFGLGIRALALEKEGDEEAGKPFSPTRLFEGALIFLAVLLLWVVFTYILGPLIPGFFSYALIFPLSVPVCIGLEMILLRFLPKGWSPLFKSISACNGLVPIALLLTLHVAVNFLEAAVLALCFVLGILLPVLVLAEVRRRASLEAVPRFLRGSPLALITLGIMALVFSSVAALFFKALGL